MVKVNSPDVNPPANIDKIGLALKGNHDQCHVGIIYKAEDDPIPYLLHLAWHFYLKNDPDIPLEYIWVDLPLDELNKTVIAQYCKHISIKNSDGKIPYGFNIEGRFFDRSGSWIGAEGTGLTCATFILAVFREMSLPLLKTEEWPIRSDDEAWQRKILTDLLMYGASTEHVTKQQSNFGGARFRPTEVFGAATSENTPVGYDEAVDLAATIFTKLCKHNERICSS